jgi:hypothetical protein
MPEKITRENNPAISAQTRSASLCLCKSASVRLFSQ